MEGTNSVESSGCTKRLKNSGEEEQTDRITVMPDFILAHILSFLPTKDVAKMLLVPRFRHCWTLIRSLSFDGCPCNEDPTSDDEDDEPYYDERFLNLVDNVLARHESSTIDEFRVRLRFNFLYSFSEFALADPDVDKASREERMASKIRTWVHFAVTKKVKVLDLDLLGCCLSEPEVSYKLPNFVLSSDHLTELKLAGCAIFPQGHVQLKSLKRLSLNEVILSEKIMDQVINGCPFLGELCLIRCYGLRKLNISNPNVKSLVVVVEPHSVFRLRISCPKVVSLAIGGSLQYAHLEDDVSSLVDASLSFSNCFICALTKYERVKMLLKKLGNTDSFAPCTWCILVPFSSSFVVFFTNMMIYVLLA